MSKEEAMDILDSLMSLPFTQISRITQLNANVPPDVPMKIIANVVQAEREGLGQASH
jgi:hypothetical protein